MNWLTRLLRRIMAVFFDTSWRFRDTTQAPAVRIHALRLLTVSDGPFEDPTRSLLLTVGNLLSILALTASSFHSSQREAIISYSLTGGLFMLLDFRTISSQQRKSLAVQP